MAATETGTRAARDLDDLYRAHVGEVFRYAYAVLGNHADAEDVTQTTFVNALGALERGERPRKASNWLITITHNIVRQRFRSQAARPREVELAHDVAAAESPDPEAPSLDDLVQALQRIPSSQREALVMRELEGRSYKEIAVLLELTPGALETLLFRARRSLAEELENLVTCERAELAMSRRLDSRLSRKEQRRLDAHLRECPSCRQMHLSHTRYRHAFKALAVVPLPISLTLFKGAPSAAAATGLPTVGAGAAAAVAASGGGASATGAVLGGGVAIKAAAVIAAVTVAGGVGYEGARNERPQTPPNPPAPLATVRTPAARGGEHEVAVPVRRHTPPAASTISPGKSASARATHAPRRPRAETHPAVGAGGGTVPAQSRAVVSPARGRSAESKTHARTATTRAASQSAREAPKAKAMTKASPQLPRAARPEKAAVIPAASPREPESGTPAPRESGPHAERGSRSSVSAPESVPAGDGSGRGPSDKPS